MGHMIYIVAGCKPCYISTIWSQIYICLDIDIMCHMEIGVESLES